MKINDILIDSKDGSTSIFVNGEKVENATSVAFRHAEGGVPELTLTTIILPAQKDQEQPQED